MTSLRKLLASALAATSAVAIAGCASTGGPFGISDEQGKALGDQEHPKIVAAFGGEISDPELKTYVDGITRKLIAASPNPNEPIMLTVLDSPVINAMALPGHVYVTRGLLTLGNSEAELAGVLGHELGHIYQRHTAKRVSRGNMASLGAVLVGILTRNPGMMQTAGQAAQLYLLSFSREQEYQADQVGVKLLAGSGYDPSAAADFLDSLDRYSKLESQIAGNAAAPPEFLSTHPNTAERVRRAAAEAQTVGGGITAERSREPYLAKIDGLLYGDDPVKQGFVRGNEFFHPELRIAFSVPSGFKLQNSSTAVIAAGQNAQMQFTGANSNEAPAAIIQGPLAQQLGVQFTNVRQFSNGGRQGATGYAQANSQNGAVDVQPFVVKWQGASNYLFLWVSAPTATSGLQNAIEQSVSSLREINPATVNIPPTQRVDIVTVRSGDTVSSLAQRSGFEDHKAERFCVLNALDSCTVVAVGDKVKIVR